MAGQRQLRSKHGLRHRTWEILDIAKPGDVPSRAFDIFILSLIFLNVIAVILGTVKAIDARYAVELQWFEVISLIIFSIEYLGRVWSCVSTKEYSNPVAGRLRFMIEPMSIIDLLAVLPFYLAFITTDLRIIRVLRLFRIFRVAKMGRYSASARLFGRVFRSRAQDLVLAVMVIALLVVLSSSFMYFAENDAQPDKFPDIPTTMWWSIVTLTTVGYGDVYPVTGMGKLLAGIIAILGIGMFALPTAILGSSFIEEMEKKRLRRLVCPHCGKEIELRHPRAH